jgi:hypothetical protein
MNHRLIILHPLVKSKAIFTQGKAECIMLMSTATAIQKEIKNLIKFVLLKSERLVFKLVFLCHC